MNQQREWYQPWQDMGWVARGLEDGHMYGGGWNTKESAEAKAKEVGGDGVEQHGLYWFIYRERAQ